MNKYQNLYFRYVYSKIKFNKEIKDMVDILVVEDNKEISSLLKDFLEKANYIVSVADTGEKALSLYEKYGAKLVLLDIMLPGIDGFSICSKIR